MNIYTNRFKKHHNNTNVPNVNYVTNYQSNELEEKIHYYGWSRVKKELYNLSKELNIIIVDYVDNYFYSIDNSISKPWIGIIHHTTSTFSSNNITNLFKNNTFIVSLKNCIGLISLSEYNKYNIVTELKKVYYDNIPVHVFKHPLPPTFNKYFTFKNFDDNCPCIYSIGGWMRNPYSIYNINITYNDTPVTKYRLKGQLMDQYFPPHNIDYSDIINNYVINKSIDIINEHNNIIGFSRPNNDVNYYIKYLLDYIYKTITNPDDVDYEKIHDVLVTNHNSILTEDYLSNDQYLNLLTSNIIFADYIDCSASNTIVECIATTTPIIVNRHPAIVEYLGDNYPLYIDKIYNESTNTLELTRINVMKAHNYLYHIRLNNDFYIESFISNIKNILDHMKQPIRKNIRTHIKKFIN